MSLVTIDGKNYVERYIEMPFEVTMDVANGVKLNQRLVMPGIAPFYLKALKRVSIAAGVDVTTARRFKWKFGNSDGGLWYMQAGQGGINDRVVDALVFGSGQFPKVVDPFILYQSTAVIPMEFEDLSGTVPYTIFVSFEGSFLFQS